MGSLTPELSELLQVIYILSELVLKSSDMHWSSFAEILCDIETVLFCIENKQRTTVRSMGETFAKKAIMLLTLKDSELVDAIARAMISEECSRLIHTISDIERSMSLYI